MAGTVAVAVAAAVIPAAYAAHHSARSQTPAALAAHQPRWPVAYVAAGSRIVPIKTATGVAGAAIRVPGDGTGQISLAPDGTAVVNGLAGIYSADLANPAARPRLVLPQGNGPLAITPDSRTAYATTAGQRDLVPIDLTSGRPGAAIPVPPMDIEAMALTTDGRTLYIGGLRSGPTGTPEVVPIQTATNTPGNPIALGGPGGPDEIIPTADGNTMVVLSAGQGTGYGNSVEQVNVATGIASPAVPVTTGGFASEMVLAPDGRFAYVMTSSAVTPVDLLTNTAQQPIRLPAGSGYANHLVITPNGERLYVQTPRKIIPVNLVTRRVLAPIAIPGLDYQTAIAMNPNGKILYVGAGHTVVPISTATGRPGPAIGLGGTAFNDRAWTIAFRP